MHYAINLNNQKRVVATDSNISRYAKYICPVCHAPVHLRKGRYKVPYFAHNSGGAKPSCALYTATDYGDGLFSLTTLNEASYRTLGLYLRLIESGQQPFDWRIEMGIPESDTLQGLIRVPFAIDGVRVLPSASIRNGGQRIPIQPGIGPFHIQSENIPEGRWKARITQPVQGLDLNNLTIFRYSPFGGRRLRPEQALYWGRSYVVIFRFNAEPPFWPSENTIIKKELKGREGWKGFFIQLPNRSNKEVQNWVKQNTARLVMHPPAEIRLISPLPEKRLPDGSYVIQDGSNVAIGIAGESGAKKWKQICWKNSNDVLPFRLSGQGDIPSVIKLCLKQGRNEIWLDEDVYESLQVFVEATVFTANEIPGIKLYGEDSKKQQLAINLHTKEAEDFLRDRRANFTGIKIPSFINVDIKWQDSNLSDWKHHRIEGKEYHENDELESIVNLLNNITKQNNKYLTIDAGDWGKVSLDVGEKQVEIRILDMGSKWRKRVQYLLNLLPSIKNNTAYISITMESDFSMMSEKDQIILRKIVSQKQWPKVLYPNLYVLLSEYRKALKKGAKNHGG
ncbi:hypothetical protein GW626_01500 [Peribacillus muralis]|uniref:competence protein CoiA family protein n=1 Tax=Peribacillus muralis TaxID=264697 RepID=UPI001F4D55EE|nr:competence protein CoiA family protein [Peribacillus muralis]MCK1994910.1 hypothetical protein [Peribacillus muralis]MCK2015544.1 hypothetical protein [Peribacillus muralis]